LSADFKDHPTLREHLRTIRWFKRFRRVLPLFRPLLDRLGIDSRSLEETLADAAKIEGEMRSFAARMTKFNRLLGPRGWISHGEMNTEVSEQAVQLADGGALDAAEALLASYYSPDTVDMHVERLFGVRAFRPRLRLARLAAMDYREARYHACIPVVLALTDGLVTELHERRRGLFAEGTELNAWDAFATYGGALESLAHLFSKGRRKVTEETLSIPYRHGILHGMDLGYDNQLVAAKTWAALFSVRDWATKAEQGLLDPPAPESPRSLAESIAAYRASREMARLAEAWRPAVRIGGQDIPSTGSPDAYDTGSPERKAVEFVTFWRDRNYGQMARCLSPVLWTDFRECVRAIRDEYEHSQLIDFELLRVADALPAATDVTFRLTIAGTHEESKPREASYRLVVSVGGELGVVRGTAGATWGLVTARPQ
jgi:hypothetical protein